MNNLSPSARLLVRAGAKAARPSEADRERLFEAMRAQLGDGAMVGQGGAAASPSVSHALWIKVSALTIGLGLLVGGAVVGLRQAPQPSVVAPSIRPSEVSELAAPVAKAVAEPVTAPASVSTEDPPSAGVAPVGPPASAPRRSPDRLAQEVALLSRATSALRSGRADDALEALNEHQSQFPKGVLAEERRAARAQALCALGRRAEAEVELSRLARSAPQSPQAARARQACGVGR